MSITKSEQFKLANELSAVPILATLQDKVNPAHTALIVVDPQNDFCAEGGMMSKEGFDLSLVQDMTQRLPALIGAAREAGALVVFVRNVYSSENNQYLSDAWLEQAARCRKGSYTVRPVCREGEWDGAFYGNIRPEENDIVVTKHRFSAFHNTSLDTILRSHGIRSIIVSGVATNVCCETTARDGFMRDYYVVFSSDGTACYSPEAQQATLSNIDTFFGEVASIDDVITCWRSRQT